MAGLSADGEEEVVCGWLGVSYGGLLKTMKKRWCLIHDRKLLWFKAVQSPPFRDLSAASHWLDLTTLRGVVADGEKDSAGHPVFLVSCGSTTQRFVAADERQLRRWVAAVSTFQRRRSSSTSLHREPSGSQKSPTLSEPSAPSLSEADEAAGEEAGQGQQGQQQQQEEEDGNGSERWGHLFVVHQKRLHQSKKRHYFELRGAELLCFKDVDDVLLEVIHLDAQSSVREAPGEHLTFVLSTQEACLHMACASAAELSGWMSSLIDAIDSLPSTSTPLEGFMARMASMEESDLLAAFRALNLSYAAIADVPNGALHPLTTLVHQVYPTRTTEL
jgi:hypothetical protein